MALRFQQTYPESGDVIDPRDWNLSHAEFAQEMNGYLDRDNLPASAVNEVRIVARAGSTLGGEALTSSLVTISDNSMWLDDDGAGSPVRVGQYSWTGIQDEHVICEWGGEWDWDTAAYGGATSEGTEVNGIRFRIVLDGVVVAESGFLTEEHDAGHCYIVGDGNVQAGPHILKVQYQKVLLLNHEISGTSSKTCTIVSRELVAHRRVR